MANPVLELIEQVPKNKRLDIVNDLKNAQTPDDALEIAKKHDVDVTPEQFEAIMAYLRSQPPEDELREIVGAVVPKLLVGPTMAIVKSKLGYK